MASDPTQFHSQLLDIKKQYRNDLTSDEALKLALRAAELYMKLLKLDPNKHEKTELNKKCSQLLDEAERIKSKGEWGYQSSPLSSLLLCPEAIVQSPKANASKNGHLTSQQDLPSGFQVKKLTSPVSSRVLSKHETLILLRSSSFNGCKFPPWLQQPSSAEFSQSSKSNELYVDQTIMGLSAEQDAILDDWKRPSEALPPPSWSTPISQVAALTKRVDLVQDAATDCSVVASMAAGVARAERGHERILSGVIFPYDHKLQAPSESENGKHVLRLNFNGSFRRVEIDNRLPVSKTSRILHVVDRNNPALLWPALIEKAYLKVRGGYDFPGSNSGTDLWILTGWIPEQIFLQEEGIDSFKLWERISKAFTYGDVLVTIGTGRISRNIERELGLAGEHDYAVLDFREVGHNCQMLIKNPWLNAKAWRDHRVSANDQDDYKRKSGPNTMKQDNTNWTASSSDDTIAHEDLLTMKPSEHEILSPGTFWMDMSDVMQNFETIYLNWNPGLFTCRQDLHLSWNLANNRSPPGSLAKNPQYSLHCEKGGTVWVVLSRHFTDRTVIPMDGSDVLRNSRSEFISLYAFANGGKCVYLSRGAVKQTPYIDSPQTLLCLEMPPSTTYTIVLSEEDLATTHHAFTISAFSLSTISLSSAALHYKYHHEVTGSWISDNAGGNCGEPSFYTNPQYSLHLSRASPVTVLLQTHTPNLSINVKITHGGGKRVFDVKNRDIAVDSGDYRQGCSVGELPATVSQLDAGYYTIICSTFEPRQLGDFTLCVDSNIEIALKPIAKDGAGRIRQRLPDAKFSSGTRAVGAPLRPFRLTRFNVVAKSLRSTSRQSLSSPLKITIELGRGPDRAILVASGNGSYMDSVGAGVRTADIDLAPEMLQRNDCWLVLERLAGSGADGGSEETVCAELFTDGSETIAVGQWQQWD